MRKIKFFLSNFIIILILLGGFNISFSEIKDPNKYIKTVGAYALKSDGSIWSVNNFDDVIEQKVGDGFSDIDYYVARDTGNIIYIALKKDGTLWGWNTGKINRLGIILESKIDKPKKIMDSIAAISGLCVLKKDGSVWVVDRSVFNSTNTMKKPKSIYKGAKDIAYGTRFIYVIDKNGTLFGIKNSISTPESYPNKVKIADNVICVTDNYFIKKNNSLYKILYTPQRYYDSNLEFKYWTKLILNNVKYVHSTDDGQYDTGYGSTCAIKTDGSLWVWGITADDGLKGGTINPQKIMHGVLNSKCFMNSIYIVKDNGELSVYGQKYPKTTYSVPCPVMMNTKKLISGWILTNNGELWWPSDSNPLIRTKLSDNVKDVISDDEIIKKDGSKWKLVVLENETSDIEYYLEKYPDDVIMYHKQFYVKRDKSVWRNTANFFEKPHYQKTDIQIDGVRSIHSTYDSLFFIKEDDTLWISNPIKSHIPGKDVEVITEYTLPVKILENVSDIDSYWYYTFIIMKNSDLLVGFNDYIKQMDGSTKLGKILENAGEFDKTSEDIDFYKKDNSYWNLTCDSLASQEFSENIDTKMKATFFNNIENLNYVKTYTQYYYITKSGELWVRGYGINDVLRDTQDLEFQKVADDVIYAEDEYGHGIFVKKDKSLWEYGIYALPTFNTNINNLYGDIKPKKVLDNVKDARINYGTIGAILEDGSFYAWGYNEYGKVGISEDVNVDKPQYIMGNINWFAVYRDTMYALDTNGTLYKWGTGFDSISMGFYNSINPLPIYNNIQSPIAHVNYESIELNEDLRILAEIKKPEYTSSAKVIINTGEEIELSKSTDNFFAGYIPARRKPGIVSYKIIAFDKNGNSIASDECKVQVISNDTVLIDSQNKEVYLINYKTIIDGNVIVPTQYPVIKSGRTLIQASALAEAFHADLTWNNKTKELIIKKGNTVAIFKIGSPIVNINGKEENLDVPAVIVNNYSMLPLRIMCDIMNAKINFDPNNEVINIESEYNSH